MVKISQGIISRWNIFSPPPSEQKEIAYYLDTKTAQIDLKIDLLTQKATQYIDLKQSLISETVTRGLDKAAPIKYSKIEWIGKIPKHWEIKRVKDIFLESKNKVGRNSSLYKVLSLTMKGVIIRDLENNKGKIPASFEGYQIVQKNNLVFCLFDMDVTPRIVGFVEQEGIITSAYTIVKSKVSLNVKYFYYYFLEQNRNGSLLSISKTLRSTLTFDLFSLIAIPFPPLSEQEAIADYLDTKTAQIDQIIQTINTQIEKLKELRKTLINDVVTGKIKVV
jgi:type I restriction enzyme, S subunit